MTEQLTDDEREGLLTVEPLSTDWRVQKALRIIDAHAADRAALVAQPEAARQVERVRFVSDGGVTWHTPERLDGILTFIVEQLPSHAALVAQVAELTRERDAAVSDHDAIHEQLRDAQSEVTRLTEALAAATGLLKRVYDWQGPHGLTVTMMNNIGAWLSNKPTAPTLTHAADRAALVAQLEAAKLHAGRQADARVAAEARVAALVAQLEAADRAAIETIRGLKSELESAIREQVELKAERDEARADATSAWALAVAEQNVRRITGERLIIEKAWRAAEARVREMSALLMQHGIEHG